VSRSARIRSHLHIGAYHLIMSSDVLASPGGETIAEMAAVFGLLGDASRLRLLAALRAAGELCVGDLAATAGMSESAASHALRLLRAHGVVGARREGRLVWYALRDGHVRMLLDTALEHVGHGDA
jgi:DNA-binding transcriptional ArsR family regulator